MAYIPARTAIPVMIYLKLTPASPPARIPCAGRRVRLPALRGPPLRVARMDPVHTRQHPLHTHTHTFRMQVGGFFFLHREDLHSLSHDWLKFTEDVRIDPLAYRDCGDSYATSFGQRPWISEMYGYAFGAAKVWD
eukprot:4551-Chlamydomonas_euryale.AAC.1